MNKCDYISQDQTEGGGWCKIFTMYQNYKGSTDWHENNILFKIYQNGGVDNYTEKNYYLSTSQRDNETSNIIFYDLDSSKGSIECRYILQDGVIDVYAKGGRVGVPLRLQVLESPGVGKITFHQRRGFEQLSDEIINKMITANIKTPYYTIEPISSGSKFYRDTSMYKEYQDYYADRYKVRLKANLTVVNSSYTGSDEYLFTIPSQFVPTWAFEEGSEYIEFTQAYSYRKTGDPTTSTMRNYCRVKMFKNGQLKVDGTVALSDTITRLELFLDIEYRRDVV